MRLELGVPPRLERKILRMAERTLIDEIWLSMQKYGMGGWYNYFDDFDFSRVAPDLKSLDLSVDYILSVGTGGSYQGVEALLEFSPIKEKFIFIGPSLDRDEIDAILKKISGKRLGFNLISKSGTTLEIMVFLNLLFPFLESAQWISIISSNPYFVEFVKEHFPKIPVIRHFELNEDIGGRFSIASIMAAVCCYLAKLDFSEFQAGFREAKKSLILGENLLPQQRGIARYLLFGKGKLLENLATNSRKVLPTLRWGRQLWAESNGKEYKSMFISTGYYPEDAHSVGQIWKEGPRSITETFFLIQSDYQNDLPFSNTLTLPNQKIRAKTLGEISDAFIEGIIEDRIESGIPVLVYRLPRFDLKTWGKLMFNEMVAVIIEADFLGVNPFNQPGVESYKNKVKKRIL